LFVKNAAAGAVAGAEMKAFKKRFLNAFGK
jgi:hypothetical protein